MSQLEACCRAHVGLTNRFYPECGRDEATGSRGTTALRIRPVELNRRLRGAMGILWRAGPFGKPFVGGPRPPRAGRRGVGAPPGAGGEAWWSQRHPWRVGPEGVEAQGGRADPERDPAGAGGGGGRCRGRSGGAHSREVSSGQGRPGNRIGIANHGAKRNQGCPNRDRRQAIKATTSRPCPRTRGDPGHLGRSPGARSPAPSRGGGHRVH